MGRWEGSVCLQNQLDALTLAYDEGQAQAAKWYEEVKTLRRQLTTAQTERDAAHEFHDTAMVTLLRELGEDDSEPRAKSVSLGIANLKAELATAQAACADFFSDAPLALRITRRTKAGQEYWYVEHPVWIHYMGAYSSDANATGSISENGIDPTRLSNPGQALLDRLAQAEAIVEKYPKTKDGVHVVPGMTVWPRGDCFVPDEEGGIVKLVVRDSLCGDIEELDFSKCSSTKEAAAKAAQEQPHAE